jgi:hypothetical protein
VPLSLRAVVAYREILGQYKDSSSIPEVLPKTESKKSMTPS